MSFYARLSPLVGIVFLAFLCPSGLAAQAGSPQADGADPAARLRGLLSGKVRSEGGTIGIEKEILKLKNTGKAAVLTEFLGHERYGPSLLWAVAESGVKGVEPKLLMAFARLSPRVKVRCSLWLASGGSKEIQKALRALGDEESLSKAERAQVYAAQLRAGDPVLVVATRKRMASKDPVVAAKAMLLAGDAHAESYLPALATLAADERKVEPAIQSCFGIKKIRKDEKGWTHETTHYPKLTTVGAVALEAASRMVSATTPPQIAWWYENESTPRFGSGKEGLECLRRYVAANAEATKAKALPASKAVALALGHLRKTEGKDSKVKILEVGFKKSKSRWRITCSTKKQTVIEVDAKGKTSVVDA